jgi:hypothetical protein
MIIEIFLRAYLGNKSFARIKVLTTQSLQVRNILIEALVTCVRIATHQHYSDSVLFQKKI